MGKESKLRNPKQDTGTRYSYSNGDRKLYDRDKMPEGLDETLWSLALYFEQLAEENGFTTPGRPIIYTELYYRVAADPDLKELLSRHTSLTTRAHTNGTCGIHYISIGLNSIDSLYMYIIQQMIEYYWNSNDSNDYDHSINDFCSITKFDYLKAYVVDTITRTILLTTGKRVREENREVKPSRRTEDEKETAKILLGFRDLDDSLEKMRNFKFGEGK